MALEKRSSFQQQQQEPTKLLDLPEVILLHILSLLPVKDAVATSLLCKNWRSFWRTNTNWNIDYCSFPRMKNKKENFEFFVDCVIYLHQGPGIQSMKIKHNHYDSTSPLYAMWIEHLVQRNIIKLDIDIIEPVKPPLSLFTCRTLVELRLAMHSESVDLPPTVSLPNLKDLYLDEVVFSSLFSFDDLINGCPIIQNLYMKECFWSNEYFEKVNISHPTLKVLSFENCCGVQKLKICISSPNLTEFRFKGDFVNHEAVLELPSISIVKLEIEELLYTYLLWRSQGKIASFGPNMCRLLTTVRNADFLLLNEWCIEYLSTILENIQLMPSDKVERMDLSMWPNKGHAYVISHLISCYPKLQSLQITVIDRTEENLPGLYDDDREDYPEPPDILSTETFRLHLRRVNIRNFGGTDQEIRIIMFLLKNAIGLERVTINTGKRRNMTQRRRAMYMLQSYPRASQVEIKFL